MGSGSLGSVGDMALRARHAIAARELERRVRNGGLPRVALVKQDCNEDLYCCSPDTPLPEMLSSTLLRSGPVSLFTLFDARFLIVGTECDPECNIWREKSDSLHWAPASWFESFRDHVPGRDHGQSRYAARVEDVDWDEFDLVISIDIAVPARVTRRFPHVVWAYYVREVKAPSWKASFDRPIEGQDLFLNHLFGPTRSRSQRHVLDFPYHFQQPGVFQQVFGVGDHGGRKGVFVEYHTARAASDDELRQLEEFGPVFARRPGDDRHDAASGARIPDCSMAPVDRSALLRCKYHVKWGGRPVFGTAKVEAIAAGCLALGARKGDGAMFLQTPDTLAEDVPELVRKLRRIEDDPDKYEREKNRQRRLVEYLCYVRPANDLLDAYQRIRQSKSLKPRAIS
jgi:hypothetical protein